jgi:RNA 2',3'-cyclic 3'-phosphodiesterase
MLDRSNMRIFVGLDLEAQLRERIARFITEVRALAPDVRWVTPESLHLTLKFIGEKPDAVVTEVQEKLKTVNPTGFDISFRGSGFFPTSRSARVFWIGIEAGAALAKLAAEVENALVGLGIPKEVRAFSPHLTLARAGSGVPERQRQDRENQRFRPLQDKLAQIPAPEFGTMTAREYFLYRSQLSSRGSRYTKIARFVLRSPE